MTDGRILVIEDNPITRKMLRVALQSEGYGVIEAEDGRSALAQAAAAKPDLVLQDLYLPDMDGVDLLERLRRTPGTAEVPILVLSGFVSRLDGARLSTAGFDDALIKPIEPSRLVQVVRKHLPKSSSPGAQPGRGRRVLVADDDPIALKLTAVHLRKLGFEVETAADGVEALERARRAAPDAVLSDVLMPRIDGFGLCLAIRKDPALSGIPVVLESANYIEASDRELALRAGASAYVLRTPDRRPSIEALVESLAHGAPPPARQAEAIEQEHTQRVVHQLERQAAMTTGLAERAALLTAQLSILTGISEALTTAAPLHDVLGGAIAGYLDAVEVSVGALYLLGPDGRPRLEVHSGLSDPSSAEPAIFFGCPDLLDQVLASGDPVVVPSPTAPAPSAALLAPMGMSSALVLPLTARDERMGALFLCAQGRDLTDPDFVGFARAVAVQIGLAVALGRTFTKVADSEERFRLLMESVKDYAIFMLDLDGRVTSWNAGAERILGYATAEIVGQPLARLYPEEAARRGDPGREIEIARAEGRCEVEGVRVRKDGSRIWAHVIMTAIRDARGELRGFAKVTRDVTERREAEARLRMLESAVLNANDAIVVTDPHPLDAPGPRIVFVNDAFVRRTGYARDEVLGRDPRFLQGPGTDRAELRRLREALERREPVRVELLNYRKDGAEFWVEIAIAPVHDARGELTHWISVQRETTERRRAEANALRLAREEAARSEAEAARRRLEGILESISDGFFALDGDWRFLYVNQPSRALLRREAGELVGARLPEAIPELVDTQIFREMRRAVEERVGVEFEIPSGLDGGGWVAVRIYPWEGGVSVYLRDITARRKAEEAQRRLTAIVEATPDFVGSADARGRAVYLNRAARRMTGMRDDEDVTRRTIGDFHPRWVADLLLREGLPAAIRDGSWTRETALLGPGGQEIPVSQVLIAHKAPGGEVAAFSTVMRDITERKKAEDTARFLADASKLLASSLDCQITLSHLAALAVPRLADCCVVDMLEGDEIRRVAAVHRDPDKQALLDRVRAFTPRRDRRAGVAEVLATGEPALFTELTDPLLWAMSEEPERFEAVRALGPRSMMIVPLAACGRVLGAVWLMTAESDRRYGPLELAFAEDLAGRAAMALENARLYRDTQRAVRVRDDVLAMVSHDLKSPLSTIGIHAAQIRRLARDDAELREPAEGIREAAALMRSLIDQLLDLGRIEAGQITLARREIDARAIASEVTSSLMSIALDHRIRLTVELPGDEVRVLADRDRVAQVLSNLVGNALKFTPEDGSITVRVERDGASVRFTVSDTGPGIPPEHVGQLFDRYWRAPGAGAMGSGLGLFIVRGFVEAHGGRAWVESTPGAGSTFSFTLPAVER